MNIQNLHAAINGTQILKGVDISFEKGKVHVIMGPNGSGKSTLASIIMGHPKYTITQGDIIFEEKSLKELPANERAKKGIFLSFQYPYEVAGITIQNFLRTCYNEIKEPKLSLLEFKKYLSEKMNVLSMNPEFAKRYLNHGFSGGEKKRSEILQLLVLDPKVAILDETDSGLDIDALKAVSKGINAFMTPEKTVIIITHYKRILEHVKPDTVSILLNGKIVAKGGPEFVDKLESEGYEWLRK